MNIAIIQARSGSTRLPGKSLMKLGGRSLVRCAYDSIAHMWLTVIAVPDGDTEIIEHCKKENMPYFEGSEEDVLSRYYHCAKAYRATRIMRLTADCPAIPIDTLLLAVNCPVQMDFVSNAFPNRTYPDGWDVEIMSMRLLELAHKNASSKDDREHVTRYIYENHEKLPKQLKNFSAIKLNLPINLSSIKCSIDTQEEFDNVSKMMGVK